MTSQSEQHNYLGEFTEELENIQKLVQTPELMRGVAIRGIEAALKQNLNYSAKNNLENTKRALENINDASIVRNYKIIYSQMGILAVSSLEATLKKYFRDKASVFQNLSTSNRKLSEIRITALDLVKRALSFEDDFGDLLLEKETSSFQNLKLIKQTFEHYFNQQINLNTDDEKMLIFYLELRHVLVHRGGNIDERFIGATQQMGANLNNYNMGDKVVLNQEDWNNIRDVFPKLVGVITQTTVV